MSLSAELALDRAQFRLEVALTAPAGGVTAVLGPNGAGKTTLLRVLAGLELAESARVRFGPEVVEDTATGRRLPPERRGVGVVFQDYLLFPRMSVLDNVGFGLRAAGHSRRAARAEARRWLDRVGLSAYAGRRPAELSGGQAQRVALARALAPAPRVLLLDEPLAALDAETRVSVRAELRRHLSAYTGVALLVTHDPLDALVLADDLVVLEAGRVVQQGPPEQVARHPRTEYVAKLVGLNLLRGRLAGGVVLLAGGGELRVAGGGPSAGEVLVAVRPNAVSVHREQPSGSPRNVWPARVRSLELHGDTVRLTATGLPDLAVDVTPAAVAELGLAEGEPVWLALKATDLTVYPA